MALKVIGFLSKLKLLLLSKGRNQAEAVLEVARLALPMKELKVQEEEW